MITFEEFNTLKFGDLISIQHLKEEEPRLAIYVEKSYNFHDSCYCMNINDSIMYSEILEIVDTADNLCNECIIRMVCIRDLLQISQCHKINRGLYDIKPNIS